MRVKKGELIDVVLLVIGFAGYIFSVLAFVYFLKDPYQAARIGVFATCALLLCAVGGLRHYDTSKMEGFFSWWIVSLLFLFTTNLLRSYEYPPWILFITLLIGFALAQVPLWRKYPEKIPQS